MRRFVHQTCGWSLFAIVCVIYSVAWTAAIVGGCFLILGGASS